MALLKMEPGLLERLPFLLCLFVDFVCVCVYSCNVTLLCFPSCILCPTTPCLFFITSFPCFSFFPFPSRFLFLHFVSQALCFSVPFLGSHSPRRLTWGC